MDRDDRRPDVRPDPGRPDDRRREERSDRPDAGRHPDDRYDDRRRDYDRRDYDRRDRGYDRRDRGRDDRYDERRRERSPEREPPKKKRGWDDMGADPANAALLLQQQQAFALMQTPQMPSMPGSKKQRELYVGNLPPESTELELTTLFTQLLSACDGYNPILGPPCPNASIAGGHTFAFVEFRDEQLCETAMQFNGITLHGRALKIGHPNGYIVPMMAAQGLKVPAELMEKLGLAACGALPPG